MASRPEQVFEFLQAHKGAFYCDDCIARSLGMPKRQGVQQITATLGLCCEFQRAEELCHDCGSLKLAIMAKEIKPSRNIPGR